MNAKLEGGCHCREVRYTVAGPVLETAMCHCSSCRRFGGAYMAWASFDKVTFRVERGELKAYRSSAGATRLFCPHCGTQIVFQLDAEPDTHDISLTTLDDPEWIVPGTRIWLSKRLTWISDDDSLPGHARHREETNRS